MHLPGTTVVMITSRGLLFSMSSHAYLHPKEPSLSRSPAPSLSWLGNTIFSLASRPKSDFPLFEPYHDLKSSPYYMSGTCNVLPYSWHVKHLVHVCLVWCMTISYVTKLVLQLIWYHPMNFRVNFLDWSLFQCL